ncbi:hypothetical protein [Liquorilactobacillus ghanensis]
MVGTTQPQKADRHLEQSFFISVNMPFQQVWHFLRSAGTILSLSKSVR